MKVLIAIDASAASQRLIAEAVARPWPANTSFCVVNAVDVTPFAELPTLIEDATLEGERLVKAGAEALTRAGHPAASKVVSGSPRRAVSAYAAEWGADLIFVGSHGHSVIGRFLLGSVAQGILRKVPCSVEIVRTRLETTPTSSHAMKILVATDGSDCSLAAAQSVARRPWPDGTLFQILSVEELVFVDTPIAASSPAAIYPPSLLEELMANARERATAAAESAKRILTQAGLKIAAPKPVPAGDPRNLILEAAQAWPADLIVLGSHGRSGLDRFLMGSVSEAVAVHARCSVEVIRTSVSGTKE